ncbi:MAG: pseudouridine synthase [Cyanobacteria bacterium]|nr:pseudouridine synthase [Cyanobacteriota bacterium]
MGNPSVELPDNIVTYWYEGHCPRTGAGLRLPRTPQVEAISRQLMATLAADPLHAKEGKMYGVLLAQTAQGEIRVLRAFSGLLNGEGTVPGWVPPIPGRAQVALAETRTLAALEAIKAELITLQTLPVRGELADLQHTYNQRLAQLADLHRHRKGDRQHQRQQLAATLAEPALTRALQDLDRQSQQDGLERRRLKRERDEAIAPLQAQVAEADQRLQALKRQRQTLSRQLQQQMHDAYRLTNFAGQSFSLATLATTGLPTGTGDCAAPKLLHAAAVAGWRPLALAEFWWGPAQGDKVSGQFYGACRDRCQPILGFLLSGLSDPWPHSPDPGADAVGIWGGDRGSPPAALLGEPLSRLEPLPLLYEDADLLVVDKPPGLLSVPGRTGDHQDSVLSRLRCIHPLGDRLQAVHRLDQATSGVLLLAKSQDSLRHLQRQFQTRQVQKRYLARLTQAPAAPQGTIALPLWADPHQRPRQWVCGERGKPSLTHYHVLSTGGGEVRVDFQPITGRTHQLRVHAAHPDGLNAPIVGDRLYGPPEAGAEARLYLHATTLTLNHPRTGNPLTLSSPVPF